MVEFALVAPLLTMLLMGIIVFGIGVFYQQQVTNAAREAARFAAVHSATASCATVSWLDPSDVDPNTGAPGMYGAYEPLHYTRCDRPEDGWPFMTAAARERLFGLNPADVVIRACWSGYREVGTQIFDAPPPGQYEITTGVTEDYDTEWAQCLIGGVDPTVSPGSIDCAAGVPTRDTASSMSEGPGVVVANRVTGYACYRWSPPLAGFLLIPSEITLRAVLSEPIQRQQ